MVAFGPEYDRIESAAALADDLVNTTTAFVQAFAGVGSVFATAAAAFDALNLARDAMLGIFPADIWGRPGQDPFHCQRGVIRAGSLDAGDTGHRQLMDRCWLPYIRDGPRRQRCTNRIRDSPNGKGKWDGISNNGSG